MNNDEAIQLLEEHPELHTYRHSRCGLLLYDCAGNGRQELVRYLLQRRADPNIAELHGSNSLFSCIEGAESYQQAIDGIPRDYAEVMDLLLKAGGRADAKTNLVGTVIKTSHEEITGSDTLLEAGVKFQSCRYQNRARSAVLARLREALDLPVDALLPLNADSLYRDLVPLPFGPEDE
jgi:hypothetical protein